MSDKRIRHLSVKKEETMSYVYFVGQIRRLPINGKTVERTISEIVEVDNKYKIYISDGAVAQEWIDIPKSYDPIVEYFIQ